MTTRAQIVAEAREWLGTRWSHNASLKGIGCDCIGLVAGVARSLGIDGLQDYERSAATAYGRQPDPVALMRACDDFLVPIAMIQALPGDIFVLRFEAEPQHFAIMTTPDYMIHSYAQGRKVVEHRIDEQWRRRILYAYSYRGVS